MHSLLIQAASHGPHAAALVLVSGLGAGAAIGDALANDVLDMFRGGLRCDAHKIVAECVLNSAPGSQVDPQFVKVIDHCVGISPRALLPTVAEAHVLDLDSKTMKEEVMAMASAIHFGSRAWIASLMSWLSTKAFSRDGPYEALASMS